MFRRQLPLRKEQFTKMIEGSPDYQILDREQTIKCLSQIANTKLPRNNEYAIISSDLNRDVTESIVCLDESGNIATIATSESIC